MDRIILHLDMDAFFAQVEQAVNPKLKGRPLIVGSRAAKFTTVVAAASYEAKAYGIESGMSAREAFRLCPQALFVPADSAKYVYTSEEIFGILKEFSPQVEMASVDEFNLDVSHLKERTSLEKVAGQIKERIKERFHLTGSIGIAPTKVMAKMASKSKKPDGLVILGKREIPAFLEDLPVEKVPGIGAHLKEYLNQMGIATCGELRQAKPETLVERFGKIGHWLRAVARGQDSDEVSFYSDEEAPPKSIGHSYTLEREIHRPDILKAWIRLLSEMVAVRLRKENLEARVVHLYLRGPRSEWFARQKTFATPTLDGAEIYRRCCLILGTFEPKFPSPTPGKGKSAACASGLKRFYTRALGVSTSGLLPAQRRYLLEEDRRRDRVLSALDEVNDRFGEWTLYPAILKLARRK